MPFRDHPSRWRHRGQTPPANDTRQGQPMHRTPELSDDDEDEVAAQLAAAERLTEVGEDLAPADEHYAEDEVDAGEQIEGMEQDDGEGDAGATIDLLPDQQEISNIPPLPPAGLKEISSLASWTVSSSKPGCGVSALRAATTTQFWQSDGPQPHWLNVHFFKMVGIVSMRIYLDYRADESYTPSRIEFWAGTHQGDLQLWSEMQVREPRGWLGVDFSGVGDVPEGWDEEDESVDVDTLPVLKCMLLQLRICENHQNGKDTHLRGLQIFARDEQVKVVSAMERMAPSGRQAMDGVNVAYRLRKADLDWDEIDGLGDIPIIR